jgi:hypothetical protein
MDDERGDSAESVALVTFRYYTSSPKPGDYEKVTFVVPARLLWYADGLAQIFTNSRRAYLINPDQDGFDADAEECWDSWHLFSASEDTDMNLIRCEWINETMRDE